jgi:hypothetical protein
MTEDMSGKNESRKHTYSYLPDTVAIREQEGWDEYIAWCKRQENSAHE